MSGEKTALPKTQGDKIEGQQGFKEEKDKPSEEIITKEETMFKIGPDGKALPEKYPIYIYDNNLESELIEESVVLMESIKKQAYPVIKGNNPRTKNIAIPKTKELTKRLKLAARFLKYRTKE